MSLISKLERIQYIDYLIQSKIACTSKELSTKLNISERQLINTLNLMKELGAPIKYCRRQKKYYYDENKKFVFEYRNISD